MKKILCILGLSLSFSATSIAQYGLPEVNAPGRTSKEIKPTNLAPGQAEFIGFRNPETDDLGWQPSLTKPSENESEDNELLERIKKAKNALKAQVTSTENTSTAAKTTILPPTLDTNWIGVPTSPYSTPLDNTMAISNGGKIIAFVNSKVGYFNTAGTMSFSKDIYALIGDATLVNNMCDPKVVYDNVNDRFIFYTQICDLVPANSKVILGFSKTNDPAAGWYFYKLSGNPLSDNSIFDYPKMGMSKDEVFVTGNLFKVTGSSTSFNQAIIYQVAKAPCYTGGTISVKKYTGISGAFTILPATYGLSGSYGPGIFCVSSDGATGGSYDYKLYRISNTIASGSSALTVTTVPTTFYSTAGDANQQGTSHTLNTGDSRALDGFYLHGYVSFVHNVDVGSGYCGIQLVRVKVADATSTTFALGAIGTADKCYAVIAPLTNDSLDKSVIMGYNESGTAFYPRTMAVSVSNSGVYSASTTVKAGVSYVNYGFGGTSDRWGDYNGICKRYNSNPSASWMAGMYGNSSKQWNQWVAKIRGVSNTGVPEVEQEEVISSSVYPNPVYDNFSVKFDIKERKDLVVDIIDMQGKVVAQLYKGIADKGENVFSFNKANLSAGVYFLRIFGNSSILKSEKIIIENK